MNDITEKYAELREELNNKDPLHRYAKLKEELNQKDPLFRYAVIKEEIDSIKEENSHKFEEDKQKREEKTLEAMESLFHSLGGEELDVGDKPEITGDAEERQEIVIEEPIGDIEEINIREEQLTTDEEEKSISGLESIVDVISKQEAGREKLQEKIDPVSARIEKLEKWIQKIAVSGPGSGEVRILNMDDVDTTDLANNKILSYNSSSGKFVFTTASSGGNAHIIQNAGSDLTARDNLNFDGTYVIATDDSGNDQSDIALSSALQAWHAKARPSGVVIGTTDSQTLTNKTLTSPVLNTGVSGTAVLDEDDLSSDSATQLATQQSIKAYVDSQTHEAGDITSVVAGTGLTGGATSGAATLNVIGGTGITANADDIAIDATVTTLTGSQTLTNKTLTSPVFNTGVSGTAVLDEDDMSSNSATKLSTQQSIKAYVDAQVTAQDLDFAGDSGGALSIDLDSESLTFTGGTGIDTSGSGNAMTFAIDSSVTTLTGSQTLTNKSIDSDNNTITNIVNADIKSSAAIAISKLATVTASRALVSSGTGAISASDITATELGIIDGGTSATSTTVADADRVVMNDNGTMVQVAVTDLSAYFDDEITAMPNLVTTAATTVGALNSGSITSGFGTIDTGSSAITTTGTVTGGTLAGTLSTAAQGSVTSLGTLTSLTVDSIIINGTNIGHTSDTDAIAIASSGNVTISQDLAVSGALTISGGTTKIESTVTTVVDPIIHLQTASGGGALGSDTNKDVGLALQYHTGSAAKTAFLGYDDSAGKLTFIPDATLSSEVVSGTIGSIVANLEGTVTGDVTGNADTATALATARTIGGTSFDGSANIAVALSATTTALASARTLGGVSFDGTANINLPGVNASGTQDTSGNATTATALATGRTIGMTGDVVWTSASFTGSGNVTGSATIQAGSVENSMLADDAVGAAELADNSVGPANVIDEGTLTQSAIKRSIHKAWVMGG